MRTELYSVRSSKEDVAILASNQSKIVSRLNKKERIKVLYKTEINWNPRNIKTELIAGFETDNPPEFYIFANALETKDNSSFVHLFAPFIETLEKALPLGESEDPKKPLFPHILVHPIYDLPGGYPAYCFAFYNKKILALPRITLVDMDLTEYICIAVEKALKVFSSAFATCPEGYIYTDKKPLTLMEKLFGRNTAPAHIAKDSPTSDKTEASQKEIVSSEVTEATEEAPVNPVQEPSAEADAEESAPCEEETEAPPCEAQPDKKKKGRLLRSFIPMKGDSKKDVIIKILVIIAIIGLLTGAYMLLDFFVISPWRNSSQMTDIQSIFYGSDVTLETDANGSYIATPDEPITKNWEGLQEINDEIVGWIKVDGTKIDYPVLHHKEDNEDSQFYLYLNYMKKYSDFGSIFVDYRCEESLQSKHVILHGHNMGSDDSMFGSLIRYARASGWTKGNPKYYKAHPVVELSTPEAEGEWIIFAVMKIDVSNDNDDVFNYLLSSFTSDAQYMNFIYNIKARSYLDIDVPINENDRLLTLSTCSYETDTMRTIVVARQVREGEDVSQYVDTVKAQTPVKITYSSFSKEYDAGNTPWYDGKEKPQGSESLEYMEQVPTYIVTFKDGNGNVILEQEVLEGGDATPPLGSDPPKAPDDTYYYTFKKWDKSYKNITEDTVITALFDKHKHPVTTSPYEEEDNTPQEEVVTPVTPTEAPPVVTEAPTEAPTEAKTEATEAPVVTEAPQEANPEDNTEAEVTP